MSLGITGMSFNRTNKVSFGKSESEKERVAGVIIEGLNNARQALDNSDPDLKTEILCNRMLETLQSGFKKVIKDQQ